MSAIENDGKRLGNKEHFPNPSPIVKCSSVTLFACPVKINNFFWKKITFET